MSKTAFFHADPHPGNVFYLPGNRIAFIDFGMVGRLSARRREDVLELMLGLVERQPKAVVDVLLDWTGDEHSLNPTQLEAGIEAFVDQYHGTSLAPLNLSQMLSDITAILREHRLGLPPDLAHPAPHAGRGRAAAARRVVPAAQRATRAAAGCTWA